MAEIERLRRRREFLALNAQGRKCVTRSMVMLAMTSPDQPSSPACRLGFTATRKLGGAVIRNRIRRRLREAARLTFPHHALPGRDYVIIARPAAMDMPFESLREEMRVALTRLGKELAS